MTKICSKCNKEYDDSYKFCEVCGTELSEQNNEEKKETGFFGKVIDKGNELIEKNN
ncbi:MAG: zinc-ribbon domain-containing protein, partial [Methanobrevibacter sp.]|uniref:zinc-ribbon domain-containing protein n=1 Tax=Methanobrevibacter sp. TaxID=66852 RepID=UPI001B19F6C2|nr:zinc-ribbon domain-containing protein [Methanobrevibacter sp.]